MTTRNGKGKRQPNRHNAKVSNQAWRAARLQEGGPSPYRKSQRRLGDVKLHQTTSTLSGRQVAQLVERRTLKVDVQGSKPALDTRRWTLRRRRPHYWQSGEAKFPLKWVYIVCKKNSLWNPQCKFTYIKKRSMDKLHNLCPYWPYVLKTRKFKRKKKKLKISRKCNKLTGKWTIEAKCFFINAHVILAKKRTHILCNLDIV